ncbi:MAG: hypothetical protein ACE148_13195 [Vicinamibacterales bacterium]
MAIAYGVLAPGAAVKVRLRQPGPVEIDSLVLKASCQRKYKRQVRAGSASTVEDTEVLWEALIVEVLDESVPAGGVLEREGLLSLPPDARPTGAAAPDGYIRWQLEVSADAGFMRAIHRAFDFRVESRTGGNRPETAAVSDWVERLMPGRPAASTTPPAQPARSRAEARPVIRSGKGKSGVRGNAGCLVIGAGFLLCGAAFLWMFFGGAAFRGRGNPYMALFAGALFAGVGAVALGAGVLSFLPSPQKRGRRQSR